LPPERRPREFRGTIPVVRVAWTAQCAALIAPYDLCGAGEAHLVTPSGFTRPSPLIAVAARAAATTLKISSEGWRFVDVPNV